MPRFIASQIGELEARYALTLPDFYKRFLEEPDDDLEKLNFGSGPLGENELLADFTKLISANDAVRSPELWFFGEHPWPESYFVIGKDGCGYHYFIDTAGKHKGVLLDDLYSWDIEHVADDCDGLIVYLRQKAHDIYGKEERPGPGNGI